VSTRTVRLDREAEQALREVQKVTGMTISGALKRGLLVLRQKLADETPDSSAWELYERLDLGPGGYAAAPAKDAKRAAREATARKHRR
jgi:hypothetical protein